MDTDPYALLKFFSCETGQQWYVLRAKQVDDDFICFGLLYHPSWGYEMDYFLLSALEEEPTIERDLHFTPCSLSEVKDKQ